MQEVLEQQSIQLNQIAELTSELAAVKSRAEDELMKQVKIQQHLKEENHNLQEDLNRAYKQYRHEVNTSYLPNEGTLFLSSSNTLQNPILQTCENSADSGKSAGIHVSQALHEIYVNLRRKFLGLLGGGVLWPCKAICKQDNTL